MNAPRWILTRRRFVVALLVAGHALALVVGLGLALGEERVDLLAVLRGTATPVEDAIFWTARVPRVALAAGVGALLGLAGACFQGVLRNPLADPFVLGTSGGAAFGAMLAMASGLAAEVAGARTACALLGAGLSLALVLTAARAGGRVTAQTILLVGVIVNAFAGAAILLTVSLLEPARASAAIMWMMGTLGYPGPWDAALAAVACGIGLAIAWPRAGALDALAAGEASAAHLGVDVPRARLWLLGAGGLCAGAAVGEAGPIGFVGLVVPHAVRRLTGGGHRLLLPLSALVGAALLVAADLPARTVVAPQVLPVGVFTAMLGAPFFLWVLRRHESGLWVRA